MTQTLTRFLDWEPPTSHRAFAALWRGWLVSNAEGDDWTFTIRSAADQRFLGLAGLYEIHGSTPELGLWIREDAQGHHYGAEATASLHAWASQQLRPEHFICTAASENHASRAIISRLNGRLRFVRSTPKYLQLTYFVPTAPANDALQPPRHPNG